MENETNKTTVIGEIISNFDFSDSEKNRISKLLSIDNNVETIFKQYAAKSSLFNLIINKLKVPGWSKGRPGYESQAINKITKTLVEQSANARKDFWDLYRHAMSNFIIKDRPLLNKLLKSIPVGDDYYESSELLRIICRNAKEYNISKETIEEFYNLWMFERVPDISDFLVLCDKTDSIAALNKGLSSVTQSICTLEEKAVDLTQKITKLSKNAQSTDAKLKPIQSLIVDIQDSHKLFEENILEKISAEGTKADNVSDKISHELSDINTKLKNAELVISTVQEELMLLQSQLEKSIDIKLEKAAESIDSKNNDSSKDLLNYLDKKLESKLLELEKTAGVNTAVFSSSSYKSPLVPEVSDVQLKRGKIKSEWDFINIWAHHLKEELDIHLSIESVTILHVLFKASNVLLVDHIRLFRCWTKCLGWEQLELDIAASPSWVSEEDWSIGTQYLFAPFDGKPRLLAIHNYNVALTACYLTPTLKLWSLKKGFNSSAKLLLIESGSKQTPASPDTLEFATACPENDLKSNRTYPLFLDSKRWDGNEKTLQHTGVDPQIYTEWFCSHTSKFEIVTDIDTIAELESITIPFSLKKHYSIVRDELQQFFSQNDSIIVAAYHIILPWLSAEYDEETSSIFFNHLKSVFTNPLEY